MLEEENANALRRPLFANSPVVFSFKLTACISGNPFKGASKQVEVVQGRGELQ